MPASLFDVRRRVWLPGLCALVGLGALAVLLVRSAPAGAQPAPAATAERQAAAQSPIAHLPKVPSFSLTSTSIRNGRPLPTPQLSGLFKEPGGKDLSPALAWSRFPAKTQSFAITMYDPEAPVEGGVFQWVVANIPASVHSLKAGAGSPHSKLLPRGASELVNDLGLARYVGGAPGPHTGTHDYYLVVSALDVARLEVSRYTSPGLFSYEVAKHAIARAIIVCPTSAASAR